jgi:hypothetical protein
MVRPELRDDKKHLTKELELLKRIVENKERYIRLLEKDLGLKGRLRSIIKVRSSRRKTNTLLLIMTFLLNVSCWYWFTIGKINTKHF